MAITSVGTLVTAANKTSATTLSTAASVTAPAGALLIAIVGRDNSGTIDGATSTITSMSDSVGGNIWNKIAEYTNGEGAGGAGATTSAWWCRLTNPLSLSTITANYSSAATGRSMTVWRFATSSTSTTLTVEGTMALPADATTSPGSLSISGLTNRSRLFLRGISCEKGSATITPTTGYTALTTASTGGTGTDNATTLGEFIITTATGSTSNPVGSLSTDWASVYFSITEGDQTVALGSQTLTALQGTTLARTVTGIANDIGQIGYGTTQHGTAGFGSLPIELSGTANSAFLAGMMGVF